MKTKITATALRKALKARRDSDPHAADAIEPAHSAPELFQIRDAMKQLPRETFTLGPCTYAVAHCWEAYDLMMRNVGSRGEYGRDLRIDRDRWNVRVKAWKRELEKPTQ